MSPRAIVLCFAAVVTAATGLQLASESNDMDADSSALHQHLSQLMSKAQAANKLKEKAQKKAAEREQKSLETEAMVQSATAHSKAAAYNALQVAEAAAAAKAELTAAEKANDDAEKLNIKAGLERARVHHLKKKVVQAGSTARALSKKRTKKIGTLKKQMKEVQRQLEMAEKELKLSLKSDMVDAEKDGLQHALEATVSTLAKQAAEAHAKVEKYNKTKLEAHANMTKVKREAAWIMYEIDAAEKHVKVLEENSTLATKLLNDETDKVTGLQDYIATNAAKESTLQDEISQAKTQAKRAKEYVIVHEPVSNGVEDDEKEDAE